MTVSASAHVSPARASGIITTPILATTIDTVRVVGQRPLSDAEQALLQLVIPAALEELLARREADHIAPPLTVVAGNVIHLPVAR